MTIAGVAVLIGGTGGADATSLSRIGTTTAITVSTTAATTSQKVTFNATVTAASGAAPTGSVEFDAHFIAEGGTTGTDIVIGTGTLTPGAGSSSTASISVTGMLAGTYQVTGSYSDSASVTWSASTSPAESLSVGSVVLNQVTQSFALSSQTIAAGQSLTFSTTVSGPAGQPTPTGTVVFTAGPSVADQNALPGGSVQLVNGAATATIGGWSGGTYVVAANYQGDAIYVSHAEDLTLTVAPVTQAVMTTTAVTLTPGTVAAGGLVTINAHVQQDGTQLPPPTGELVNLLVGPVGGDPSQAIPLKGYTAVPLDAHGDLSVTTGGWTVGDWVVYAGYVGDVGNLFSTGTATLHVVQPTTGDSVSYTGDTQDSWGSTGTLAGQLVDGNGHPLSGKTLTFTMGGTTCAAATDSNGHAACDVPVTALPGQHAVTAAFAGDPTYKSASVDNMFTVLGVPTTTTYTGATAGGTGQTVTLAAHLVRTSGSKPLAGEPVTLTMGAESCTATTATNGDASCTVTVGEGAGTYSVAATFGGDGGFLTSSDTKTFTVAVQPTATAATDAEAMAGSTVILSATLTSNGQPVAGKTISITAGSQTCSKSTDSSGSASCSIDLEQGVGTHPITATFAGDGTYATSTDHATLTIDKISTTTTYTGGTQGVQGTTATLSAHVTGAPDKATVSFTVGTQSCTGTTSGGDASCTVTLSDPVGSGYTVVASYAGDETHSASSASTPFTIVSPITTTQAGPVGPVLVGSSATLSATVTPASATGTVTFTSNGTTLCSKTLSGGAASCNATFAQTGSYVVTATYAGDGVYPRSSGATTVLVYAFAPGGGSFVVGDKSASGPVTFWGAQWSKANSLSGGDAPDAFEGFALNGPATCGASWSTDPGNSSPPPAGPLPAYMAVIVTSKSTKSGSQISGTIVKVVIVKTSAGYDANPGHAGTGTVVTTLCG